MPARFSNRLAVCLLAAVLIPLPLVAQTLAPAEGRAAPMSDSVVSRLVAWRARTDQPVMLSSLTAFEWDSFSVIRTAAGDAMANCNREGFLPCAPDLQPPPGTLIQVLRFDRAGRPVYQERIMVASANFADPLPNSVPRAQATLVTCPDGQGQPRWCVQSQDGQPQRLRSLDGG